MGKIGITVEDYSNRLVMRRGQKAMDEAKRKKTIADSAKSEVGKHY